MKLNPNEMPWAPAEKPEYLCILDQGQRPPQSSEILLTLQVDLLKRLVNEANEGELDGANRMLENGLQEEEKISLPPYLLKNPRCPSLLLRQPGVLNLPLSEWHQGMTEALKLPPMPTTDALEEAHGLTLETFMSRIL